jgi:hypothetical protein
MAVVYNGVKFDGVSGPAKMVEQVDFGNDGKTRDSVHSILIKQFKGSTPQIMTIIGPDDAMKYYGMTDPRFK